MLNDPPKTHKEFLITVKLHRGIVMLPKKYGDWQQRPIFRQLKTFTATNFYMMRVDDNDVDAISQA